jgi:asparagine synthase (glutamine-hydrolysing)
MCGIGGTVGAAPDPQLLEAMAATMVKRGPDNHGIWAGELAGLTATRLAIIDLDERSNQPLHLGTLHLTFNGELYNYRELRDELRGLGHRFVTEGDAEVLLHAWAEWDEAALDRFNGMFAFAIWDEAEGALTLASDPFGEKPAYYARCGERLVFASEARAVALDPEVTLRADEDALAAFVARGVMPVPPRTFFVGVERLPPAHVLRWQDGRVSTRRYWRPQPVELPPSYGDAVEELRGLLADSIRLRLRSDVPVGTSLSGGIDSSTIVMLSSELAGDHTRHAFTARFPGYERDEWRYAAEVAERAEVVEHHAVEPTAKAAADDLDLFVLDEEEPVGSLSVYAQWRVMQAAHEAGVTVLLDGQGGDELFGGYPVSPGFAVRSRGPRAVLEELASGPSRAAVVGRSVAADLLPGPARRSYLRRSASPYTSSEAATSAAGVDRRSEEPWIAGADPLRRELLAESFETSLPELLRYGDRSSMAHSRELRLPFLDRRVAELAFSLPPAYVYDHGATKRVLRDVGRGLVPESVLRRTDKVGYEPPQARWLESPELRERIAAVVLDPAARKRGLYDIATVERELERGSWSDHQGVWRVLNAELWLAALTPAPAARPAA